MRLPLALVLLVSPAAVAAQPTLPVQEALLRAKPAVVLVVSEVSAEVVVACHPGDVRTARAPVYRESGTGWFVNPDGWVVTSAHVVSAAHQPHETVTRQQTEQAVRAACMPALLAQRGLEAGARPDVEEQLARDVLVSAVPTAKTKLTGSISVIPSNGVRRPAAVAKYSPPVAGEAMSGRDLALLRVESSNMPTLPFAESAQPNLGDRLYLIGFPNVVMTHELLSSSATLEPSVTSGAISGLQQDVRNEPLIQTDAAAAPGASGSPAIDATGAAVGMLSFVTSDQGTVVQGFNFVIRSAAIRDFLRGTGVPLGRPGAFDVAWRAGLADHFAGRYARAARELRQANRVLPGLPDVKRMIAENTALMSREPLLPWRIVGVALLVAAAGAVLAVGLLRRRRSAFRIAPAEVARLVDGAGDPPIILDVRDAAAYAKSPVRIPKSVHVTLDELATGEAIGVEPSRTIVAYCT